MKKVSKMLAVLLGLGFVLLVTLAFVPKSQPQALPPRPEPEPTQEIEDKAQPDGAQIQLTVENAVGGEWTQVQWQDTETGKWHNVDGWAGQIDQVNKVIWWVGKADLDSGPFRWQIFDGQDGSLLATSDDFDLPSHSLTIVEVSVSLQP